MPLPSFLGSSSTRFILRSHTKSVTAAYSPTCLYSTTWATPSTLGATLATPPYNPFLTTTTKRHPGGTLIPTCPCKVGQGSTSPWHTLAKGH